MRAEPVHKVVECSDELPKTMVGKILRRQLLDEEKQNQAGRTPAAPGSLHLRY